jgi:hypothetical protein
VREALPGTQKSIRGFSGAALLIVDEAARVDDALYYAVKPMLAVSGGSLLMLSTPYGRRGVFFEITVLPDASMIPGSRAQHIFAQHIFRTQDH